MGIESEPKLNPTENPELQEVQPVEKTIKAVPVLPTPEDTSETDIAAQQEADAKKSRRYKNN